ncbi:MAG: dethiobiotin synthase [Candidatus Gastranaerophilales bacterium]|nr:dethiobiotin synthase [Candidatus Gastranaerophilales bacterium]
MNIFVTGTDTDVGKTIITAGLAGVMQSLGYEMAVYKPVQTGCSIVKNKFTAPDLEVVKKVDSNIKTNSTYNFKPAVSPSLACDLNGSEINLNLILKDFTDMKEQADIVITEGAGGLMSPVYKKTLMADVAAFLKLPVLIVTKPYLGAINHTLLTIKAAQGYGLDILGVVMNLYPQGTKDMTIKTCAKYIKEISDIEILGVVPKLPAENGAVNPESLISAVLKNVDLTKVFRMEIPKLL